MGKSACAVGKGQNPTVTRVRISHLGATGRRFQGPEWLGHCSEPCGVTASQEHSSTFSKPQL